MIYLVNKLYEKVCRIKIFTNGKWIKNFPMLLDKIYYIDYHISYTLELIKIPKLILPIDITYKIVINDDNIDNMVEFIKLNPYVNEYKIN